MDEIKALSQQRFGQYADRYVHHQTLAKGAGVAEIIALAALEPDHRVLDIATGGGHTALALAPYVHQVIATDLSTKMLGAARSNHQQSDVHNLHYVNHDAERFPFPDDHFDRVTCRVAPHHFPDIFRFVLESTRVLKSGGWLIVQDLYVPEEERAARYCDAIEKYRDPSHHRMWSESEWRGAFLDAGLTVAHTAHLTQRANMEAWAKVQDCTPYQIERLHLLLAQAPDPVRAWWNPTCIGTPDAEIDHVYLLIGGIKS
ncbi:MAG: class I SAM-dependent methyltransferase [Anaerolineae bacterium]|jgi:SAM-dependent methyltransferase|nr:class I SAM-dependent methyltransferase [Anaerolineae bacterium]